MIFMPLFLFTLFVLLALFFFLGVVWAKSYSAIREQNYRFVIHKTKQVTGNYSYDTDLEQVWCLCEQVLDNPNREPNL